MQSIDDTVKQFSNEFEKDERNKGVQAGSELSSRNTLNKTPTKTRVNDKISEPDGPWSAYRPKSGKKGLVQNLRYSVKDRSKDLIRSVQVFKGLPEANIDLINDTLAVDPIELSVVAPTIRASWMSL